MTATEKERFLSRIGKPVRDVQLPPASWWEGSRIYRRLRKRLTGLLFERDMRTAGRAFELEHFDPDFVHYEPSPWLALRWALRSLRVGPDDVFVDFGCGKGRVVCEAARRPFGRVVGVEVSPRLREQAEANVERQRRRFRCRNVELVTADAAEWTVPEDMTVAYLYHPFAGDAFRRVIDNIVQSIARGPRRVRLVYVCPVLEDDIVATGCFRLVQRRRGRGRRGRIGNGVAIFEHDPHGGRP